MYETDLQKAVVKAVQDLVKQGYIKHIGLTKMSNENFKRALKVTPLKMIRMEYSLVNHNIEENGIFRNR